jgi:two-component system sensor histidine kinase KdpD
MNLVWPIPARWPPTARAVVAAALTTAAVTVLAFFPSHVTTHTAALAYVLAVLVATAVGGMASGLIASLFSFLALNFLFTPSIDLNKTEDLVALLLFLVVSGAVGVMLSTAMAQQARAERREQEARLLHHFASRLLWGEAVEEVLQRFARAVTDLLGLARCEIVTGLIDSPVVAETSRLRASGDPEIIPMMARGKEVGSIQAVSADGRPLSEDERQVMEMFAGQLALALDGMRLASRATRAELEANMSKARAALFSSVTHDLRTPLSSILAAASSLQDPEARFGPGDRHELLDTIRQEAERLNRLVGNVLQLSRSRAGALALTKTPMAIEDVVNNALAHLDITLKRHDVQKVFAANLPEVQVDAVQVDQVMTNLLENAARFAPPGSEITVSASLVDGRGQVKVVDRGPGIPKGDRALVFEPFATGAGGHKAGTGLGLAISKAIVEAHGGRIWIDDGPDGGTSVVFELPAAERE